MHHQQFLSLKWVLIKSKGLNYSLEKEFLIICLYLHYIVVMSPRIPYKKKKTLLKNITVGEDLALFCYAIYIV